MDDGRAPLVRSVIVVVLPFVRRDGIERGRLGFLVLPRRGRFGLRGLVRVAGRRLGGLRGLVRVAAAALAIPPSAPPRRFRRRALGGLDVLEDAAALPCGHIFCLGCVDAAFERSHECPTCGAACRKKDVVPSTVTNALVRIFKSRNVGDAGGSFAV